MPKSTKTNWSASSFKENFEEKFDDVMMMPSYWVNARNTRTILRHILYADLFFGHKFCFCLQITQDL